MNRVDIVAIVLILFGLIIYLSDFFDQLVVTLTWPLLSGSSDGKAILFFIGMGSLILLNSIIRSRKGFLDRVYLSLHRYSSDGRKFLIILIAVAFLTYIVGFAIELYLRAKYGVSPYTIFVSLNPLPSSSSPMHIHVFKSTFGYLISQLGVNVPAEINTAGALIQQVIPWAYLILFTLPLAYLAGLFSMDDRRDLIRLILAFGLSLILVSMVDGGLFSQPGIIGLAGVFGVYTIRSPFKFRQLLKPTILIALIIVSGVVIESAGSNSDYHDITVINLQQPLDLNGYQVIYVHEMGNKTVIRMKTDRTDKVLLENLFTTLRGKADGFFMSWNFASYL